MYVELGGDGLTVYQLVKNQFSAVSGARGAWRLAEIVDAYIGFCWNLGKISKVLGSQSAVVSPKTHSTYFANLLTFMRSCIRGLSQGKSTFINI